MRKLIILSLFGLVSCQGGENKVNLLSKNQETVSVGIRYSDNTFDTITIKQYQVDQLELTFTMLKLGDKTIAYDVRRYHIIEK